MPDPFSLPLACLFRGGLLVCGGFYPPLAWEGSSKFEYLNCTQDKQSSAMGGTMIDLTIQQVQFIHDEEL
eukprot:3686019-Amphidinium_carterae.1